MAGRPGQVLASSPAEYHEKGLAPDRWRLNGVAPNVVQPGGPPLGDRPLLSWPGAP
jgi:hypothetical protein